MPIFPLSPHARSVTPHVLETTPLTPPLLICRFFPFLPKFFGTGNNVTTGTNSTGGNKGNSTGNGGDTTPVGGFNDNGKNSTKTCTLPQALAKLPTGVASNCTDPKAKFRPGSVCLFACSRSLIAKPGTDLAGVATVQCTSAGSFSPAITKALYPQCGMYESVSLFPLPSE